MSVRGSLQLLLLVALLAMGCGPSISGDPSGADGGNPGFDGGSQPDTLPPPEDAAVFAHSAEQLYRVDPDTLEVSLVGNFEFPLGDDSMTDIAIDKSGRMIGVSFTRVYEVDENTARCIYLADLSGGQFNGLSFVPGPGPDPADILIGADLAGDVHQLDPETGQATVIGNYGSGYASSGDIVSVRGFGTVATLTAPGVGTDLLARIDPQNGYRATPIGETGHTAIWGLGFWGGKIYGFTDNNQFLDIDVTTGQGQPVEVGAINWWGAGVTTTAPVVD